MWKKRRGRPPALWNQPEYHARYEMLRAHFARTYPGLPAPYVEGMAQQALTYEVAASPAADNMQLREDIPLPDFIIPGARIAGGWTGRRQARLAPQDVLSIRARYAAGGVTQQELASAYGVRTSTISDVVRAVSWRTLTDPSIDSSAGKEDPDVSSDDTTGEDA